MDEATEAFPDNYGMNGQRDSGQNGRSNGGIPNNQGTSSQSDLGQNGRSNGRQSKTTARTNGQRNSGQTWTKQQSAFRTQQTKHEWAERFMASNGSNQRIGSPDNDGMTLVERFRSEWTKQRRLPMDGNWEWAPFPTTSADQCEHILRTTLHTTNGVAAKLTTMVSSKLPGTTMVATGTTRPSS